MQSENAVDTLYQEALALHQQHLFDAAEQKYLEYLHIRSDRAEAWLNLGILYYQTQAYQNALEAIFESLALDSFNARAYYVLGSCFEKSHKTKEAILAYQDAIALDSNLIDAYINLANALTQIGEITQAENIYRQAITADPNCVGSYLNLGNILLIQNKIPQAIESYQTALALHPKHPDLLNNLEIVLNAQNNPEQLLENFLQKLIKEDNYEIAIKYWQEFLESKRVNTDTYLLVSDGFKYLNRTQEAIETLRRGISFYPKAGELHFALITLLQTDGRMQEAIASAKEAMQVLPDEYVFKLFHNLMLPPIYDRLDEISFFRQRFSQGLQDLIEQIKLDTPEEKAKALKGFGCITNFYLPYQGENDLDLQTQYGNLLHRVMRANYPQWVQPRSIPTIQKNQKIRVGYLSAFLHSWSGTFLSLGWLRHCNKENFEIYSYYIGNNPDLITQHFQAHSDFFHHIPHDIEAVCQQVLRDRLHILVFPELGMDAQTMQIASLRLAPIQCVAWGQPVTSGLPTVDYFLSSELMEPPNNQNHYSETLIRLPNIGVAYPKPEVPQLAKKRSDFQLREDAVVYLTTQAPYKYLPQHDYIFAEIALKVPQAQFVFLRAGIPERRLQRAFAAVGLNSQDYCLSLPVLPRSEYLMLNLLSDIYLDTLNWSGGNTTLDAVACSLPVVTYPGEFMRGRHSDGILRRLGVTDTIAQNEAEYIDIAVKLGLDPIKRRDIAERIKAGHDYLYDDKACVKALEAFYQQVVQAQHRQN